MKFGDNLKRIRKKTKITQEDLAEKVGVSRQSVSKWECSEAYPEMKNILKLCEIFNCKLNEIVNEDLTDFNSLDEGIKMSIVKFKKEKQKTVKGLSKAIYVIADIAKVLVDIYIVFLVMGIVLMPILVCNIELLENNKVSAFGKEYEYQIKNKDIVLVDNENVEVKIGFVDDEFDIYSVIETIRENTKEHFLLVIECILCFTFIAMICMHFAIKNVRDLFYNINSGDTPFTKENIKHIKDIAKFMIGFLFFPDISDNGINIGVDLLEVLYILVIFCLSYVFEYGYEIQLDSKGKIYGDEVEEGE